MPRVIPHASLEMQQLLRDSASENPEVSAKASLRFAKALQEPIKQGVLYGDDFVNEIFEPIVFPTGAVIEFPLDFLTPTNVKDFSAFTVPNQGYIPQKHIEGSYVTVQTFDVAAAIDWLLKYGRDARWDVASRAMQVLEAMFVRKRNSDAWHALLAAIYDRNVLVYDADATAGFFTKRLVSLMKISMRRNGGGNATSLNRARLTHLFISPENMEDIRNWNLTEIDDVSRREIFLAEDNGLSKIFGVNLRILDELGVGQEFQLYFTSTLGGTLASGDTEFVVGLDLQNRDAFVQPIRQEVQVFPDPALHRSRKQGYYGWGEWGFGVLSNYRVIGGSN